MEFKINIEVTMPQLKKFFSNLDLFNSKTDQIMSEVSKLGAKVDTLQSAIDDIQVKVTAKDDAQKATIATLEATVQELKDVIAANGTAEEFQAVADKLDAATADVKSTIDIPVIDPPTDGTGGTTDPNGPGTGGTVTDGTTDGSVLPG